MDSLHAAAKSLLQGDLLAIIKSKVALVNNGFSKTQGSYAVVDGDEDIPLPARCPSCSFLSKLMRWFIFVCLIVIAMISAVALLTQVRPMTDHELIVATNAYSPFLERITTHLEEVEARDQASAFRQRPSPLVDQAWIEYQRGDTNIILDEDMIVKLGKSRDRAVAAPAEWGFGPGQYVGATQGPYALHCLDRLRMFAYGDHYFVGPALAAEESHTLHCIQSLLENLQCKFSTDVYTAKWVTGVDGPVVDIEAKRKCQKYWELLHRHGEFEYTYTDEMLMALRDPSRTNLQ
ncbi:hypothetical protein F5Y16DRAFT_392454 [Xylariaceae sp. FL0255]|nr:hypothetical protein F5Y16DRAFT_392454 [Xylariaceae sp. FL0255]